MIIKKEAVDLTQGILSSAKISESGEIKHTNKFEYKMRVVLGRYGDASTVEKSYTEYAKTQDGVYAFSMNSEIYDELVKKYSKASIIILNMFYLELCIGNILKIIAYSGHLLPDAVKIIYKFLEDAEEKSFITEFYRAINYNNHRDYSKIFCVNSKNTILI